jgi:hypothetical protein
MPLRGRRAVSRAVVGADSALAIAPLADCSAFPKPSARRQAGAGHGAAAPGRFAGRSAHARRPPPISCFDGETNGAGVKLNARFDGAPAGWRMGPADVTGLVEGNDAQVIAALWP